MQGDLTSKQKVIEIIEEYYEEAEHYGFASAIADLVEAVRMLDVSYDVGKVVAELEELSLSYELNCDHMIRENKCHESADCGMCAFKQAIEIVRNGGKE